MRKEIIKILFAGNASDLASEISLELHRFFENKPVLMEIEHIFAGWEVFKKIEEDIFDFDIVVFDKKLKMTDAFLNFFAPDGHSFILLFFDSSRDRKEERAECLEEFFKVIKKRFLKS